MHDTDNQNLDVRETHNTRMEYLRKNRTTWHIHNYLCKLSRSNLIKLQAIQVRHCMQHARQYHTTKLEEAPVMPVSPEDRHQSLPFFPSSYIILFPCHVKPTRKMNKNLLFRTH